MAFLTILLSLLYGNPNTMSSRNMFTPLQTNQKNYKIEKGISKHTFQEI